MKFSYVKATMNTEAVAMIDTDGDLHFPMPDGGSQCLATSGIIFEYTPEEFEREIINTDSVATLLFPGDKLTIEF